MAVKSGYYDFDFDFENIFDEKTSVEEMFYLRDTKQRKFYLNVDIEQSTIVDITRHILQINKEDKGIPVGERTPIIIYITSNGGEVDAGFELIDAIDASKTPVYTVNFGYQYSMGFLIGIAGHKRFATKNAKFLMHDGNNFAYGSGQKVQDRIRFDARVEERVKAYVIARTNITEKEYDDNLRVEWYMFADEAKEKGVTDFIVGVDCDIDAIV